MNLPKDILNYGIKRFLDRPGKIILNHLVNKERYPTVVNSITQYEIYRYGDDYINTFKSIGITLSSWSKIVTYAVKGSDIKSLGRLLSTHEHEVWIKSIEYSTPSLLDELYRRSNLIHKIEDPYYHAIEKDNLSTLLWLLNKLDESKDNRLKDDRTIFNEALICGSLSIIKYYIEDKNLEHRPEDIIRFSIRSNRLDLLKYMVECRGNNPNIPQLEDDILYSTKKGHTRILKYLLGHKLPRNLSTKLRGDLPRQALQSNNLSTIRYVFEDLKLQKPRDVFSRCIDTKSDEVFRYLLQSSIPREEDILNIAEWGSHRAVNHLLDRGVEIPDGSVQRAIVGGNIKVLKFLDKRGYLLPSVISDPGTVEVLDYCYKRGSKLLPRVDQLTEKSDIEIIKYAIDRGCRVTRKYIIDRLKLNNVEVITYIISVESGLSVFNRLKYTDIWPNINSVEMFKVIYKSTSGWMKDYCMYFYNKPLIVSYMTQNKIPVDWSKIDLSDVEMFNLDEVEAIDALLKAGAKWNKEFPITAARAGHLNKLVYAYNNECKMDKFRDYYTTSTPVYEFLCKIFKVKSK